MRVKNILKILNIVFFGTLLMLGVREEVFALYDNNENIFYDKFLTVSPITNIVITNNYKENIDYKDKNLGIDENTSLLITNSNYHCYDCSLVDVGGNASYIWSTSSPNQLCKITSDTTYEACNARNNVTMCENPDVLKVFYFFNIIVDIVKIVIPIGLIIFGMIDFTKALASNDEGNQKKSVNLFIKRIIMAVLVFLVPWIVETVIIWLGNLAGNVNFTDCLENANREMIDRLEGK